MFWFVQMCTADAVFRRFSLGTERIIVLQLRLSVKSMPRELLVARLCIIQNVANFIGLCLNFEVFDSAL